MVSDKNISPVDWYVGTYQLRFTEHAHTFNEDLNHKFLCWKNTVIVRATSLEHAYDKVVAIGMKSTMPYKGGPDSVDVQWVFEGVVELLPIYEALEDGAEIMWSESTKMLKTMRRDALSKQECIQDPGN